MTLAKLKTQNNHFYERDLTDVILNHHIVAAKSSGDLIPIKEYAKSEGRWQDPGIIEKMAERFLEFGDYSNAIECFGIAYACYKDWFRWRDNTKYLAAIAAIDGKQAEAFVLKECYNSASGSGGGYDTPPIAATGLDILRKPQMVETIFNDFLAHCESMFAQLLRNDNYVWLKEYKGQSAGTNQLILNFVVDELSTEEIDHGERLIKSLARLAIAQSEDAIPVLIARMLSASGRILRRLLTVFLSLAAQHPDRLVTHQQAFAQLLDREDLFCCQIVLCILRYVDEFSPLEAPVARSVQRIDSNYSSSTYDSSYKMKSSPTPEFMDFLKRNTLFDFSRQVLLINKILQVPSGSLIAAIEEYLIAQNWSIDDERDRVKDDCNGHVHPQG